MFDFPRAGMIYIWLTRGGRIPLPKQKTIGWWSFTLGYHYKTDAHRTFFQNRAGLFCFWIAPPLVKQGLASDRGFPGSQNHAYIRFTYSATMYLLCLYNNLRQRATLPFRLGNICGISLCICLRTFQRLRHSASAR